MYQIRTAPKGTRERYEVFYAGKWRSFWEIASMYDISFDAVKYRLFHGLALGAPTVERVKGGKKQPGFNAHAQQFYLSKVPTHEGAPDTDD